MIDTNDSTWAEVKRTAEAGIADSTLALRSTIVDWNHVQVHRGRVEAFEEILALATVDIAVALPEVPINL